MSDRATDTLETLLVMLKSMSEDTARVAHNVDVIIGIVTRVVERLAADDGNAP